MALPPKPEKPRNSVVPRSPIPLRSALSFDFAAEIDFPHSSNEFRSETRLSISIKEPTFHYCLQYKEHRVFVWTYRIEVKNVGESLVKLRSRKLTINEPSLLLLIRHSSYGQLTLWGEQPYIRPGEALVFTPGIAFDGKTGTINAGWIDGYRPDTFEDFRFDINTNDATFDIEDTASFDVIDIDQLGQNGKISLNSAKAFLCYLKERKDELNSPRRVESNITIDFSTIPGVSFQDTLLLCNYLICLGRENHDKERKFDFGPVLPEGISAEISSVDHFMKPTNHIETEKSDTKGSAVGVTIVASSIDFGAAAQALLNANLDAANFEKFIRILPLLMAAFDKGIDLEAVLTRAMSEKAVLPLADNPGGKESLPIDAERLFGSPPPQTRPSRYTKSNFPKEWFENDQIFRAATHTANQLNSKGAAHLTPEEIERRRTAERFIKAYRTFRDNHVAKGSPQPMLK